MCIVGVQVQFYALSLPQTEVNCQLLRQWSSRTDAVTSASPRFKGLEFEAERNTLIVCPPISPLKSGQKRPLTNNYVLRVQGAVQKSRVLQQTGRIFQISQLRTNGQPNE